MRQETHACRNTRRRYGQAWIDNHIFSPEGIVTRMTSSKKLIWGWLRLFLGVVQMVLVSVCVGLLFSLGMHWKTWIFFPGATAATIIIRFLYHGQANLEALKGKIQGGNL